MTQQQGTVVITWTWELAICCALTAHCEPHDGNHNTATGTLVIDPVAVLR